MADIEEPGGCAAREMLFHDARVLDRKLPAAEVDEAPTQALMFLKKRGTFQHDRPLVPPARGPSPAFSPGARPRRSCFEAEWQWSSGQRRRAREWPSWPAWR